MDRLEQIIDGCRRRDRQSQEKLYREYYRVLFSLCKNFFDEKHDVLTAINNGMLRVFQNIDKYDQGRDSFFNWMYTIVRNTALTTLRDQKRQKFDYMELVDEMGFESAEDPFETITAEDISFYLAQLPVATRRIISLHYVEGFLVREIAEALVISNGTVKWHLSEGRARLKNLFGKPY